MSVGNTNIVGFFCEDIREEKNGQHSIIGVLPDRIRVKTFPGMFSAISFYVRYHFGLEDKPTSLFYWLKTIKGERLGHTEVSADVINASWAQSREQGMPHFGLISKGRIAPFPVEGPGRSDIVVSIDGVELICGSMEIILQEAQGLSEK